MGQAVDLIIHIEHDDTAAGANSRYVSSVLEVRGSHESGIDTNEVFAPGPDGRASAGGAHPLTQRTLERLARVGWTPNAARPAPVAPQRPVRAAPSRRGTQ